MTQVKPRTARVRLHARVAGARAKVVVIGGGIAGLSAAWALARRGAHVELLEQEPVLCAHSSGRNAAIFRCLHLGPGSVPLALRTAALLDGLLGSRAGWLRPTGVLYAASEPQRLRALAHLACAHELPYRLLTGAALWAHAPELKDGEATHGLLSPTEGVLELHVIQQELARAIRAEGAEVRTGASVLSVQRTGGAVTGVRLAGGEAIAADAAVIAAGAWSGALGRDTGSPVRLAPTRRHLALLDVRPSSEAIVWRLDDEVYFRRESGGALASPCDETRTGVAPPTDSEALVTLGEKLRRTAPALADASVRTAWAGVRTFAFDRAAVVGADPGLRGLYWLAGLGGQGMSVGVGAGELLGAVIDGHPHPLEHLLRPGRRGADCG